MTDKPTTPDEATCVAVRAEYAPDGEPELTNEELLASLGKHLTQMLSSVIAILGVGKCVLHNKTFTLELCLSPRNVVIEDFIKDAKHD